MPDKSGRLKIGFLTSLFVENTPHTSFRIANSYMIQALEKHCGNVSYIGPIQMRGLMSVDRVLRKVTKLVLKKNFMLYHTFFTARRYTKLLTKHLTHKNFDIIFTPLGWTEIALLKTNIPIVLLEDANVASLKGYYPEFTNLLPKAYDEANTLEKLALTKASLVLYPAQWAAHIAIENYQINSEKIKVLPWGANITTPPTTEVALKRQRSDRCQLLFVGVDWHRKGGAIAFETLLKLEEKGIKAHLIVCGCVPPREFSHERMTVVPYLSRQNAEQSKELEKLYETSDFFFLPTRKECYGFVFCEASSFGLPSIATNTGGVSGAVVDGENGALLSLEAGADEYAELIAQIYRDDRRYAALVQSTRAAFDNRLNWDAWGISVSKCIYEMLEREQSHKDIQVLSAISNSV